MFFQLFANGDGAASVRLHGADIWRRRREGQPQNALIKPRPTHHGRGGSSIGCDLQHGGLRDEPAPITSLRKAHASNGMPVHSVQSVQPREASIHHCKVAGHHVLNAEIRAQYFPKVGSRLLQHAVLQIRHEFGIQVLVGSGVSDLLKIQPLIEEIGHKPIGTPICKETFHLCGEHLGAEQFSGGTQAQQLQIGSRAPKPKGKPCGQRMTRKRAWIFLAE